MTLGSPEIRALRRALLRWYRRTRRDLPWRRTSDAYAIWVSETMLQQTRVDTVVERHGRFLARFPTLERLAAASEDDVLHEWAGLGYYSRARNLHRAARIVARDGGGAVPRTAEELRRLPGVGPYTAAAVASIAFGRPEAVVDGNVARVASRIFTVRSADRTPAFRSEIERHARELLAPSDPGAWNQAMMELGALVCTPRAPACASCPVERFCGAKRAGGGPESFPVRSRRPRSRSVREVLVVAESRGRYFVRKRESNGLLAGLWEFPTWSLADGEAADEAAERYLRSRSFAPIAIRVATRFRHAITTRRFDTEVVAASVRGRPDGDGRWVPRARLAELALPAASLRARDWIERDASQA